MNILKRIENNAASHGERIAFHSRSGEISYQDLWDKSDRLAAYLDDQLKKNKKPVVVYGHKNPLMLVCFLACVKSGRAYCPVDSSMPKERITEIVAAVDNQLVLATEFLENVGGTIVNSDSIMRFMNYHTKIDPHKWCKPEDVFYIIFTSGSTGKPKGVQITDENLSRYVDWSINLGDFAAKKAGSVFLNQAPFSFDLSVMDTYTGLATGATIWAIDKKLQNELSEMLSYMQAGRLHYWVSTPSFADICLADQNFNDTLLPDLRVFLFCGETLTKDTAQQLSERFPKAIVVNTYGPTESTVAVTGTVIDENMLKAENCLPIGMAKPGTKIRIVREDGSIAQEMEKGEIQIVGDTVSPGYYKNKEKSDQVFSTVEINGEKVRAYKTGDEGYLDPDGMLYYSGRIDLQIKLHGYRIELGDIESNLLKINGVSAAAVIPRRKQDKIMYLAAFVVCQDVKGSFEDRKEIRMSLKRMLPEYMVPKKISFVDSLPLTNNGKTDRKKLEALLSDGTVSRF